MLECPTQQVEPLHAPTQAVVEPSQKQLNRRKTSLLGSKDLPAELYATPRCSKQPCPQCGLREDVLRQYQGVAARKKVGLTLDDMPIRNTERQHQRLDEHRKKVDLNQQAESQLGGTKAENLFLSIKCLLNLRLSDLKRGRTAATPAQTACVSDP